jgi:hypothetical protein
VPFVFVLRPFSLWINTMKRWIRWAAAALALTAGAAFAQTLTREAPADVKPARMAVGYPPEITIDGKADRLSPGARIRDTNNMAVLSGSLSGKTVPVVYKRDPSGLVHEVWLLTEAEYAKLGGTDAGDPEGYKRFVELLAAIFSLRK